MSMKTEHTYVDFIRILSENFHTKVMNSKIIRVGVVKSNTVFSTSQNLYKMK
jgi:hypothetical protein